MLNFERLENKSISLYKDSEFNYRNGPVPFTGKKTAISKNFFKFPKTLQEKKYAVAIKNLDEDEGIDIKLKLRNKRSERSLVDSFDSIARSEKGDSWKEYRKNQWR